ncbi:hypothetical protein EGR_03237 [Echinococcus granulosus]|uniref:Uncharacterized protein n=1 Tax=Echinococcus granulosus TaxID=6210 RepID=W6V6G2_ECHGR|nr:hypothetical protein EGR_03237 [Echinococcus granulosus]EUB61964.1 hypothetical protein EGR_03237 [Echinococcus granulosus]
MVVEVANFCTPAEGKGEDKLDKDYEHLLPDLLVAEHNERSDCVFCLTDQPCMSSENPESWISENTWRKRSSKIRNIGICLTHESVLTKCLSDADCPETKCCHRQRRRGGFGTCAYVCDDNEILMDMPSNLPVGSYRGDDFWNYWLHKRHFTTPRQRYFHRKW